MREYTRIVDIGGNRCVVDKNGFRVRKVVTFEGNSTRPRPTYEDGARDGDELLERDTKKVFTFDEDFMDWL